MPASNDIRPDPDGLGRRALLRWTGVGAFAAFTHGYFVTPAVAAQPEGQVASTTQTGRWTAAQAGLGQAGGWSFDEALRLFVQPPVPTGTAVGWEFDTDEDAEGWRPTNGVAPFTVSGGTLTTNVTGSDPYIFAPPVHLIGQRDRLLRLRARASGGDRLGIYFATEESPNLAEDKMIPVPLPMDGEFHDIVLDLGAANELWRSGTVTTIRFDIEPASSLGVTLKIDHVRIERLGARLAATTLGISLGSVRPGEELTLETTVSNVGGEAAEAFPAALTLPDGVVPAGGAANQTVPALEPGGQAKLTWTVRVTEAMPGAAAIDLAALGGAFRFGAVIPAVPEARLRSRWSPKGVDVFRDAAGHVYLQNAAMRLCVLAGSHSFVQLLVDVRTNGRWRSVATSQPLTWISVQGANGPELLPVVPDHVQLVPGDPRRSRPHRNRQGRGWYPLGRRAEVDAWGW